MDQGGADHIYIYIYIYLCIHAYVSLCLVPEAVAEEGLRRAWKARPPAGGDAPGPGQLGSVRAQKDARKH